MNRLEEQLNLIRKENSDILTDIFDKLEKIHKAIIMDKDNSQFEFFAAKIIKEIKEAEVKDKSSTSNSLFPENGTFSFIANKH